MHLKIILLVSKRSTKSFQNALYILYLHIYLDTSSIEVFTDHYCTNQSNNFIMPTTCRNLSIAVQSGFCQIEKLETWGINIWTEQRSEQRSRFGTQKWDNPDSGLFFYVKTQRLSHFSRFIPFYRNETSKSKKQKNWMRPVFRTILSKNGPCFMSNALINQALFELPLYL